MGGESLVVDAATGEIAAKLDDHPLRGAGPPGSSPEQLSPGARGCRTPSFRFGMYLRAAGTRVPDRPGRVIRAVSWSAGGRRLAAASGRRSSSSTPTGGWCAGMAPGPVGPCWLAWGSKGRVVAAGFYGGVRWYERAGAGEVAVDALEWKGSILALAASGMAVGWPPEPRTEASSFGGLGKDRSLEMPGYPAKIDQLASTPPLVTWPSEASASPPCGTAVAKARRGRRRTRSTVTAAG